MTIDLADILELLLYRTDSSLVMEKGSPERTDELEQAAEQFFNDGYIQTGTRDQRPQVTTEPLRLLLLLAFYNNGSPVEGVEPRTFAIECGKRLARLTNEVQAEEFALWKAAVKAAEDLQS